MFYLYKPGKPGCGIRLWSIMLAPTVPGGEAACEQLRRLQIVHPGERYDANEALAEIGLNVPFNGLSVVRNKTPAKSWLARASASGT